MCSLRFRTRKAPSLGTRISICSAWTRDRLEWNHLEGGIERQPVFLGGTSVGVLHLLSALVAVGLRDRVPQPHLKLVAAQRHVPVVADEAVKAVKHQVVGQVEASGAGLLA